MANLTDSAITTLGVANTKCQLIRDGASGDPTGGAVYARRVKHAARLWIRRTRREGRNPLARFMIEEGRRRALEAAPKVAAEGADEVIHLTTMVALQLARSELAVIGEESGTPLDEDLTPIIESFTANRLTWREALATATEAIRHLNS